MLPLLHPLPLPSLPSPPLLSRHCRASIDVAFVPSIAIVFDAVMLPSCRPSPLLLRLQSPLLMQIQAKGPPRGHQNFHA
jgi:hypothetical protein